MKEICRKIKALLIVILLIISQTIIIRAAEPNELKLPEITSSSTRSQGYYTLMIHVPKEYKGGLVRVYENNKMIDSMNMDQVTNNGITWYIPFEAKRQGNYTYHCEIVKDLKVVSSSQITVNVAQRQPSKAMGVPGDPILTQSNWDGSKNYSINMNMWWGNNAYAWLVYENGKLIYSNDLVDNTPSAQNAIVSFTNKPVGTYVYQCEVINEYGTTISNKLTYSVKSETGETGETINPPLPEKAQSNPAYGYMVQNETTSDFEWILYISNPNKDYVWDGTCFDVWSISFETSSEITTVEGAHSFIQKGSMVTIYLKNHERVLTQGKTITMKVKGNKKGSIVEPQNMQVQMMRGNVPYPEYKGLPSTWYKGKQDLQISDLIEDPKEYYETKIEPGTNSLIAYHPVSETQLIIAEPREVDYPVNGTHGIRLWVPSKYVAMGLGFVQEIFKINPHYMTALGTKENFTFGLVPASTGYDQNPIVIDGETWYWPIQPTHPDGPFQQEAGNFNEVKKQYVDYLGEEAAHANYITLDSGNEDDPKFITAAISSAMSLTMTREYLYSIPKLKLNEFFEQANDPYADIKRDIGSDK